MHTGCGHPCQHASYGAHLRAKNIRVEGCRSAFGRDRSASKANQRELDLYESARKQGVQPAATKTRDIREALDVSDRIGRAFNANVDDKYVTE